MNILVLHRMGDPEHWRRSIEEMEYSIPNYAPEHNYIIHNASLPFPEFAKEAKYHAIVLCQTFLCHRYHPAPFKRILEEYDFVRESDAYKIALPQDDYDCSAILDRWMIDWNIDLLYTVCPEHWDVLYPKYSQNGTIRLGFTGYVSNELIDQFADIKPFAQRTIDVSYRASKLTPNFGRLGYLKGTIGDIFIDKLNGSGLNLDISVDPKDIIPGGDWHTFLSDSKFCLGTNSGSSLLDPEGSFGERVVHHLVTKPNATFEDVEEACFPGEDMKYQFTAISPRNIEAALIGTGQILVNGSYSNILEANSHYIPMDEEVSNHREILEVIRDKERSKKMIASCKEAILSFDELRYDCYVEKLIETIKESKDFSDTKSEGVKKFKQLSQKYDRHMSDIAETFWKTQRRRERFRNFLVKAGARKVKRMFTGPKR